MKITGDFLFFIISARNKRKVLRSTPDRRIGRPSARDGRITVSAIHATGWQTLPMYRFDQDSGYLLRKRSVLGSCSSAKRFF
jgi:hypothetical protein